MVASGDDLHVPVMVEEVLRYLQIKPTGIYVDVTVGAGGHTERIAAQLTSGRVIALDRDDTAVAISRDRLKRYPQVVVIKENYSALQNVLRQFNIAEVNGILIDAGVSSIQLNTVERGFSFQSDGPLDMRMDPSGSRSAASWLSTCSETRLREILKLYGDVRPAGRIAKRIKERCARGSMQRTKDLVDAVREALHFVDGEPDEIRTVFQAIRIAVNDELNHLEAGLRQAANVLAPGGRLVVIAFHSAEDRVVKHVFRELTRPTRVFHPDGRVLDRKPASMREVVPRPLLPTMEEIKRNPRAKSARMRVIEKLS